MHHPPLALDGPLLSIRRFAVVPLKVEDLINLKTMTPQMADILAGLVKAKVNILISGGTGSGKTTLLNVLSANIPVGERVVTIEDRRNCRCSNPMWCGWKRARPISRVRARSRSAPW